MTERKPYPLFIAILFTLLLLYFLYSIAEVLLLFFVAALFGVYLAWITEVLQRNLRIPRGLAMVGALLFTGLLATGIGYLIVPPLILQGQELIKSLPGTLAGVESRLVDLARRSSVVAELLPRLERGQSYTGSFIKDITGSAKSMVPYVFTGVGLVIHLVTVLIAGLYLALKPNVYREGFILLAPPIHRELVRDILDDLGRTLRAWIVGQILAMIVLGMLTWIGLWIIGVPYPLAFGTFTGMVAIVPFFGTLVSTLLPALFVLGEGGFWQFFSVILLGVGVHLFEANIVAPMIMERQVHLPPVLSIFAVLVMAHLLHVIGLLVAVPVLCTVMVVMRRVYVHRVLEGKGFRRALRDRPIELRLPDDGQSVLIHPKAYEQTLPSILEN